MEWVASAHLSPTGDRVVLNARGQLFVAPAQQGRIVEAEAAEPTAKATAPAGADEAPATDTPVATDAEATEPAADEPAA